MDVKIIVKPFDWNDNMSEVAQEDFSRIQKNLSYGDATSIGTALAKLELLEKQGCRVQEEPVEISNEGDLECERATTVSDEAVSLGVFEQVKWERDVAIDQLNALGYGLGEKIRVDDDCISRTLAKNAIYALCEDGDLKENSWRDNPHVDAIIEAIDALRPAAVKLMEDTVIEKCDDCISRRAVLDRIEESVSLYGGQYTADMLNMWGLFTQFIKEMDSVKPGGWRTGVPDEDGKYLATVRVNWNPELNYEAVLSYTHDLSKIRDFFFEDKVGVGGWYDFNDDMMPLTYDVEGWQELPEIYKSGGEE